MKLRVGAKKNQRPAGRQRRDDLRSAPSAYSYHAQRATRPESTGRQQLSLADKRTKILSLRFWAKRSGAILMTLVVVACVFQLISLSTQPRIILLDSGNTYAFQDATVYQQAASKQLASSFWNRNKVTIDTKVASNALRKQFSEVDQVSISLPLVGRRPIYYLQASSPAFVIQTVNGNFVLDASGKLLIDKESAPEAVVNALPVISDQTGIRAEAGKQIISSGNTAFIQTVVSTLALKGVTVDSIVLPAQNVQQLDVRVSGKPYVIKFDMHDSGGARQQVGSYLATINTLDAQGKVPSQYIDVRVLGRTYFQ